MHLCSCRCRYYKQLCSHSLREGGWAMHIITSTIHASFNLVWRASPFTREEGSEVMSISELFQCLCTYATLALTWCAWNCTHEDLVAGWSDSMLGTAPRNYWTRRSGTWLVSRTFQIASTYWKWHGTIWLGCTPGYSCTTCVWAWH